MAAIQINRNRIGPQRPEPLNMQMSERVRNDDAKDSGGPHTFIVPPPPPPPSPRLPPTTRLVIQLLRGSSYMTTIKFLVCLVTIIFMVRVLSRDLRKLDIKESNRTALLLWNEPNGYLSWWSYYQCGCVVTSYDDYDKMKRIDAVIINADRPYSLVGLDQVKRKSDLVVVFAARNPMSLVRNPVSAQGASVFNFTMSYRLDSDLIWTDYFFATPQKLHQRVQKFSEPEQDFKAQLPETAAVNLHVKVNYKTRLVVYMMYEVNNYTLPESLYLEKLRQHIELDAYESCTPYNDCGAYKFMLIFEPSSCPDYVHPQFYMALAHFVVPVLVGGGNLSQLVPPGSYISGADYSSPKMLAEYLTKLSMQPKQYEQFFWWHSKYQLQDFRQPYCALCRQLQKQRSKSRQPKKFLNWWTRYQCPNHTDRLGPPK